LSLICLVLGASITKALVFCSVDVMHMQKF